MKSKYVILASALLISVATFAQKDQIKDAEKALKSGDAQGAITILKDAENMVVNAKDVERAKAGPFGGPIAHGYLTLSLGPVFLPQIFVFKKDIYGIYKRP